MGVRLQRFRALEEPPTTLVSTKATVSKCSVSLSCLSPSTGHFSKHLRNRFMTKITCCPGCAQSRRHTGRQWTARHHGFRTLLETSCWGVGQREGWRGPGSVPREHTRSETACLGVSAGVFPALMLEMPGGQWLPSE